MDTRDNQRQNSGPVRKSDEMLPADANGAGRTPAGRPAVLELVRDAIQLLELRVHETAQHSCWCRVVSEEDAGAALSQLRRAVSILNSVPEFEVQSSSLESPREHVCNALEMLTNGGDDHFLMGNERRVVYDAGVIDAVKTRLNKALGL